MAVLIREGQVRSFYSEAAPKKSACLKIIHALAKGIPNTGTLKNVTAGAEDFLSDKWVRPARLSAIP